MEIRDAMKRHPILGRALAGTILVFAAIGLFLTGGFVAVRLGLTRTAGRVDLRDRYFHNLSRKRLGTPDQDADAERILIRLSALHALHPRNARLILAAFGQHQDPRQAERMLDALDPYLADDSRYRERVRRLEASLGPAGVQDREASLYPWMNTEEWQAFRGGVLKDRDVIRRAAEASGVDPRLIVTMMVSEQIRLFTARRESFKAFFAPLAILGNETKFSLGVCGIKEDTAKAIEDNLRDPRSPFHLGAGLAHVLDYDPSRAAPGATASDLRIQRLTDPTHYPSYLYTGLFIRQILAQWQAAGHDLSGRPEILATLFNLGFAHSSPGPDPHVGGADITVGGRQYTFGSLAFEFFYSGDLGEAFPFSRQPMARTQPPQAPPVRVTAS